MSLRLKWVGEGGWVGVGRGGGAPTGAGVMVALFGSLLVYSTMCTGTNFVCIYLGKDQQGTRIRSPPTNHLCTDPSSAPSPDSECGHHQ